MGEAMVRDVRKEELATLMIGHKMSPSLDKKPMKPGKNVLELRDIQVLGDHGEVAVKGISFNVRRNEIFGIAGVSGNGQKELVEVITGLRKSESGSVSVEGQNITNRGARYASATGITHVPEERLRFAIAPNLFVYDNAVLKRHHVKPFSNILMMNYGQVRDHAEALVENFQVSTPSLNVPMKNLSGGNIQKLILGREISGQHALLVASHPTYGLDVGATAYIREQLLSLREKGGAVLLVSEDLDEIFSLCDRVAVIFNGEIMGIVDPSDAKIEDIGMMMAGSMRLESKEAGL